MTCLSFLLATCAPEFASKTIIILSEAKVLCILFALPTRFR
jgi:hypothetical protein